MDSIRRLMLLAMLYYKRIRNLRYDMLDQAIADALIVERARQGDESSLPTLVYDVAEIIRPTKPSELKEDRHAKPIYLLRMWKNMDRGHATRGRRHRRTGLWRRDV